MSSLLSSKDAAPIFAVGFALAVILTNGNSWWRHALVSPAIITTAASARLIPDAHVMRAQEVRPTAFPPTEGHA